MKNHIKACLFTIVVVAIFESIFKHTLISSLYDNATHPWRDYGSFFSVLSGMALFTSPIFMNNQFNEGYKFGLILGSCVAIIFTFNDVALYFLQFPKFEFGEMSLWVILEFLEFSLMGFLYIYIMKNGYKFLMPSSEFE